MEMESHTPDGHARTYCADGSDKAINVRNG